MTNKYSYLLVGDPRGRDIANQNDELMLSGLYLWSTAFHKFGKKGDIDTLWRGEDLEEYDVIHVNYTPSNIQLPTIIRDQLGDSSSTKLVMNVDLDVAHWGANFAYYSIDMMREIMLADVLFHVEAQGAVTLEHLTGKGVHVNPHPVDVSKIYDHVAKEREPMIATMYHRYTGDTMTQWIAQRNIPLRKVLFGYTPGKHNYVANAGMYDQIITYQPFGKHVPEISKALVGCDLYPGFTYGRAVIEFAALAIPAVCSGTIAAANWLFPDTAVNPFDTRAAEEKLRKILEDQDFADSVIKRANARCGFYSLENSYKRFCSILEEAPE